MTTLPRDNDNQTIQALRLADGKAHNINATDSSARNGTAFDDETRIISVYATVPVYLNFGDVSVTASSLDHYFPEGLYYDFAIGGDKTLHYTHLSVLAADNDGTVYISEKR